MDALLEYIWIYREEIGVVSALISLIVVVYSIVIWLSSVTVGKGRQLKSTVKGRIRTVKVSGDRLTSVLRLNRDSLVASGFDGCIYSVDFKRVKLRMKSKLSDRILRVIKEIGFQDLIAVGDDAGRIYVLDRERLVVRGSGLAESSILWIGAGVNGTFFTAERSGEVAQWSVHVDQRGVRLVRLRVVHAHSGPAFACCYLGNRRTLVSVGADGMLTRTDLETGQSSSNKLSSVSLLSLVEASGGFFAGDANGNLIDVSGAQSMKVHDDNIRTLLVMGDRLISGSKDGTVKGTTPRNRSVELISNVGHYVYDVQDLGDGLIGIADGMGQLTLVSLPS